MEGGGCRKFWKQKYFLGQWMEARRLEARSMERPRTFHGAITLGKVATTTTTIASMQK